MGGTRSCRTRSACRTRSPESPAISFNRRRARAEPRPFQTLLDYVEAGDPLAEFLEDFPTVSLEQVVAALEQAKDALLGLVPGELVRVGASRRCHDASRRTASTLVTLRSCRLSVCDTNPCANVCVVALICLHLGQFPVVFWVAAGLLLPPPGGPYGRDQENAGLQWRSRSVASHRRSARGGRSAIRTQRPATSWIARRTGPRFGSELSVIRRLPS